MAIIEELSSDEEQPVQLQKPARTVQPAANFADIRTTSSSSPVQELLLSKKTLNEDAVFHLSDTQGTELTLQNILATAVSLLDGHQCESLNISRLERLSSIVAWFARQADTKELSELHESSQDGLEEFLKIIYDLLKVPSVFLKEEYNITSEDAQKQSFWLAGSTTLLQLLQSFFMLNLVPAFICNELDRESKIIIALSKFTTTDLAMESQATQDLELWVTPLSHRLATQMLSQLASKNDEEVGSNAKNSRLQVVQHILLSYIKPLFTTTPHPMLNPETGRKLDRRRGGDLFGDSYMDGEWKGRSIDAEDVGAVGCWKTYLYILTLIDKDDLEDVWPLLVPPMMTLLDDHQTYFKHQGIIAVSAFLARTPAVLLHRTGLNDLIQQSLTTAFSFTSEAENVSMIRDAISTNLQLVNLLYPKSTSNITSSVSTSTPLSNHRKKQVEPPALIRFNTLSSVYQHCIISIFTYASSSIPFMTLAFKTIPLLINELGKGSIRFLQDSMTVLCSSLGGSIASKALSSIFTDESVKMHIAATEAIDAFVEVCRDAGRMERWRGMILSSVATLWCNVKEQNISISTVELDRSLMKVVQTLKDVCGDVAMQDCEKLLALDRVLFAELFRSETERKYGTRCP